MSIIAIIPARAGSKRLKNKNILPLNGKPLISYTIEAAKDSGIFDEICVSSDSEEVIQIAKSYDLEVPFKRPDFLSTDYSTSIDVILHALNYYSDNMAKNFEDVCLLQPTSPLRDAEDIRKAYDFYQRKKAASVVSVTKSDHPKEYFGYLGNNFEMDEFVLTLRNAKRSQDCGEYYRLNGAIYLCKKIELIKEKTFFLKRNCFGYVMDPYNSVDIDNLSDLKYAQFLISNR